MMGEGREERGRECRNREAGPPVQAIRNRLHPQYAWATLESRLFPTDAGKAPARDAGGRERRVWSSAELGRESYRAPPVAVACVASRERCRTEEGREGEG